MPPPPLPYSPSRAPPTRAAATGVSLVSVRQTRVCPARQGLVYDLVLILSVSAVLFQFFPTYILLLLLCRQGVSARRRRSLCCLMAPPRRVLLRLVFIVPESSYVALAEKQVVRCTCALSGSSFSNVFTYINVEKLFLK